MNKHTIWRWWGVQPLSLLWSIPNIQQTLILGIGEKVSQHCQSHWWWILASCLKLGWDCGETVKPLILSASNTWSHGMIFDHSEGRAFMRCIAAATQALLSQSFTDDMYRLSSKWPFGIVKYRTVNTRLWLEYEWKESMQCYAFVQAPARTQSTFFQLEFPLRGLDSRIAYSVSSIHYSHTWLSNWKLNLGSFGKPTHGTEEARHRGMLIVNVQSATLSLTYGSRRCMVESKR